LDRPGGFAISDADHKGAASRAYDLHRLENAIAALVESHRSLQAENAALREQIDASNHRVRDLDEKLLQANQRRQDVAKRIDELIAQIDHLGVQFDAQAQSLGD
jgi:septal ring factor EnvC (AmiA/AmiB activator)